MTSTLKYLVLHLIFLTKYLEKMHSWMGPSSVEFKCSHRSCIVSPGTPASSHSSQNVVHWPIGVTKLVALQLMSCPGCTLSSS